MNPGERPVWTPIFKPKPQAKKPYDVIPLRYLADSLRESNAFVQFLLSRFDQQIVKDVIARYRVGTIDGFTVYWQVDQQGRIRTGKMIRYDAGTGKRIKTGYCNDWVHAKLKRDGKLSEDFQLEQCFFGSHLLTEKVKTIAIVEAEKTALVASLCLPNCLWLACGGKSILKAHRLQEFQPYRVVLFPDADGFQQWEKEAQEARRKGLEVICSDLLERRLTVEQKTNGWDLADFLLTPKPRPEPGASPVAISVSSLPVNAAVETGWAYWREVFAGHCKRCGDYLKPDGSCDLCRRPLPF